LAYATPTRLRVYRLVGCGAGDAEPGVSLPKLSRVKAPTVTEPLHHLAFFSGRLLEDNKSTDVSKDEEEQLLLAVTAEGGLQIYSLEVGTLSLVSSLLPGELQLTGGAIGQVTVSGHVALLADTQGVVVAVDLLQSRLISKLPSYREAAISAIALR
jgi:hypothetical protein